MTKYEAQAQRFLNSTGSTLRLKLLENAVNPNWNERFARDKWLVCLSNSKGFLTLHFWDSGNKHWPDDPAPTAYDVLAGFDSCIPDTHQEFCSEFGYHHTNESRRIFNECKRIADGLKEMYTEEELDQLAQIC